MANYKLRSRQKMQAINRMVYLVAGTSILGLAAYYMVVINTTQVTETQAGIFRNMMLGYDLNSGDVISAFSWDDGQILKAEIGSNALSVSKDAVCMQGGTDNTKGIGPGKSGDPLRLEISSSKDLNLNGIDVALDYKRLESNCSFFSRGKSFDFGMSDGKLSITYKIDTGSKKPETISAVSRYEVPDDGTYRNYRFIYTPNRGKAEMFVNDVVIWSNETDPEMPLAWDETAPMIVGADMKGNGSGQPCVDNLAIRATRQVNKLPVTLLNFEARAEENYVMITWYTAGESNIDSFIVERSSDAISFNEVGRIKAAGNSSSLLAYAIVDKQPSPGVTYYRLVPSNLPLRSMMISLIGYKYRGKTGDVKITDITEGEPKN
ncbi:MAG TPA: hypothetical protein VFW78_08120 [Bacteroidia bacterium]|nr:hypothetical protein [Bacteroidia bacterium]